MAQLSAPRRARIADDAEAVLDRKLGFQDWLHALSKEDLDDDLVAELVDIITHEPKVGGFLGVSRETHAAEMIGAYAIIAELRRSSSAI